MALTCALGWGMVKQPPPRVLVRRWACSSDLCPGVARAEAEHPHQSSSGGGPAALTCALGVGCAEAEHPRQSWSGCGPAALTVMLRR